MSSQNFIHLINFSRKMAITAVFFLIPLHFLKLGFSGWQIGAVISLFAFAPFLFSFPTGWANDRFSIKEIIHAALALQSLLLFFLGRVHHLMPAAFVFLLLGMANNALDVSTNNLYYKDDSEPNPNKKYSRLVFWSSLGSAVGPLLAGLIVSSSDFPTMFTVFAAALLLLQPFVRPLNHVRFGLVPLKAYKSNLFRKNTVLFSVMIFIVGLHWGVEGTVYSPFLKQYFGLSTFSLSVYIFLSLLVLAFSSFLIGFIKFDIRLNKRIFLFSMVLSGGGLALMVNPVLPLSFLFRVVHEIGDGLLGALIILFISRLFERESIGGSSAILLAVMTFGHMVGALAFSTLGFHFGLTYPFIVAGLLLVANAVFGQYCFKQAEY